MKGHTTTAIVSILLAVVGLAIVAVLVSRNAQTGSVLSMGGSAFSNVLCRALAPVTGSSCGGGIPNVSSTITFGGAPIGLL